MQPQWWIATHSWECGTCSTVCLHRWWLLCQMVHLHVWMKIRSTAQSQSQEAVRHTRWPDAWSDICSSGWRAAQTTLPESPKRKKNKYIFKKKKKKKGSLAHAAAAHVHPLDFWDLHSRHPGAGFPFVKGTAETAELFRICAIRFSFWNLLSQFQKQRESSRVCRTHQKSYSNDKNQTSQGNIIMFMTETTTLITFYCCFIVYYCNTLSSSMYDWICLFIFGSWKIF